MEEEGRRANNTLICDLMVQNWGELRY